MAIKQIKHKYIINFNKKNACIYLKNEIKAQTQ